MGLVHCLPRSLSSIQQRCTDVPELCLTELRAKEPRPLNSSSQGKCQSPQAPPTTPTLPVQVPSQSLDLNPSVKAPLGYQYTFLHPFSLGEGQDHPERSTHPQTQGNSLPKIEAEPRQQRTALLPTTRLANSQQLDYCGRICLEAQVQKEGEGGA